MTQPSAAYAATTGTNLALATNGATVSSSSSIESLPDWAMANINDGSEVSTPGTSLGWTSNVASAPTNPEWVQLDLGADQTFNQVKLFPRTDGIAAGGGFPVDFNVEVSTDEQNWTMVDEESNFPIPNPVIGQEFNFASVTARYVRVTGTKLGHDESNNYYMQLAEMEVYNADLLAPPSLTADTTDNDRDHDIEIAFTDDEAWRDAIKAVKVGTNTLDSTDYTISAGTITIKASTLPIGSLDITVRADVYANGTAVQAVLFNYPGDGAGTANDPYQIATAEQLDKVRNNLQSGVYFKLTADIDLSGYQADEGWIPIGDSDTPFQGDMDGNGYKIKNLKINSPSGQYIGLFGYTGENSIVHNIRLENAIVSGNTYVGGFVGRNLGTISNSSASGNISGKYNIGGLVGGNEGTISSSSAAGSVSGNIFVGGLVGNNIYYTGIGTISNSYATGNVSGQSNVGGLAGYSVGHVSNSFATGSVSGSDSNVGGLVGYSMGTVSNSYAMGSVSGSSDTGGLVGYDVFGGTAIHDSFYDTGTTGQSDTGKGDGKSTAAMKTQSTYTDANWDFASTWGIGSSHNNGYPYLRALLRNVTYDGNENTAGDVPSDGNAYWQGDTVTVLDNTENLTRTGYSFAGWNTAADGSGTSYSVEETFSMDSFGVTLYAKWNPSVTYDKNTADGGTVPANSITYEQRATVTVLGNTGNLVKDGYAFAGWNTAADGSGNRYTEGDSVNIGVTSVILYAQWLSANALLSGLSVDHGTLAPEFAPSERSYTADVASNVSSLRISFTKADPSQSITVTGATYVSVTDSVYYSYGVSNLIDGSNPIRILVMAEDGTENTYDLNVNRESSNADLSGLALSTGALDPAFAAGTTGYTSSVANDVSSLTVTATVSNPNATVTVNGTTATSGQASGAISLQPGSNSIVIVVTAQDQTTKKTYTVNVTRPQASTSGGGDGGSGSGGSSPTSDKVTSTDGTLTLPAGRAGEVGLEDAVTVSIPTDATHKDLRITIERLANTQNLPMNTDALVSSVYEILKNFSENFSNPVTLTFKFDPNSLKGNEKPVVFYYDETKKEWVKVGGTVDGNRITVDVDHFTKFAVFAVDAADTPPTEPAKQVIFSDISGHWAESAINQAVSKGIVTGYTDGTFKPNRTVTRAEFAVMLMNALKPQGEGAALKFADTAKIGAWAQKAVAQAVQAGIINGYADGTFRPNAEITRAEMAAMIAKALGKSTEANAATGFADDKDIPAWAKAGVAYVKQTGIMQGKGDNEFAPQDYAARAEAATVLLNLSAAKRN
ncbi:S-layer homology domain-containing protein [Cohnella suwonensis]|uniref:S-layer homology domain-containing protein n=1 Tax=Cohnella suwonensis TaxID=696072 RepID=A0ABW0LZQ2_9BACL